MSRKDEKGRKNPVNSYGEFLQSLNGWQYHIK